MYLETLQTSVRPLVAFTGTFVLFLYICAVLGQQLFSGKFVNCNFNQLITKEICNTEVCADAIRNGLIILCVNGTTTMICVFFYS